jgi:protein TonB
MSLRFSLLLSIALHLAIFLPLLERSAQRPILSKQTLEVDLHSEPPIETIAESSTSEPDAGAPPLQPPKPTHMRGAALRRAQSALSKHLFYPDEAIKRGLEGEVLLLLMLDNKGRVKNAEIARSSGHGLLDAAALDAVRQIGTLPGNPSQTLFPVSFRLE